MSGFNLPPGVSVSDIPGNSDADAEWDKLVGLIGDECALMGWDAHDAFAVWNLGRALHKAGFALVSKPMNGDD